MHEASVGQPIKRLEDRDLLVGKGCFVDDIHLPNTGQAAFLRSPHAHARISSIDCTTARALPGVIAVLTLHDLALVRARMLRSARAIKPSDALAPHVLADREVAFVGEPIALVIAVSRHLAEDAAALIEIEYEPLPAIADCRDAVAIGAPSVLLECKTNIAATHGADYGDVAAAFANPPIHLTLDLAQHRGCAVPMEARGVLAEHRAHDGALCVWSSTQMPHDLRAMLVEMLGIDEDGLRVITPDVGGGFGPKYCIYPEEIAIAAAARLLRRPVKWIEDRREHFCAAVQERDQFWHIEIAAEMDGRLRGLRGEMIYDQGAYLLKDANLPYNSATAVPGPYLLPAYEMRVLVAQTNKVPASSVRGAGYPEAAFTMERAMDALANHLGLDRAEIRRRNLIPATKMPYTKPMRARSGAAIIYDSGDYPASQTQALHAADWDGFPARQQAARTQGRYLGIGLANAVKGTGRGPFESASVRIAPNGRITLSTGAAMMGQGLATALAQICGDELGVSPDKISVIAGDTGAIGLGLGGFASRQLVTAGTSTRIAAARVAQKAKRLAALRLEVAEEDLELSDGAVRVLGVPQMHITLADCARILRGSPGGGFPDGLSAGLEESEAHRTDLLAYANTTHVCELEVDVETGDVRIIRYIALQDCGTLINPLIVQGQILGGIVHGIGNALFERMIFSADAQPLSTSLADYLLPTAPEVPWLQTIFRQTPSPTNPLGAKGVGEVGTIPVAAAIISAIENALSPFRARIGQTPIAPDEIIRLVQSGG